MLAVRQRLFLEFILRLSIEKVHFSMKMAQKGRFLTWCRAKCHVPRVVQAGVLEVLGAVCCNGRLVVTEREGAVGCFVWAEQEPVGRDPCILAQSNRRDTCRVAQRRERRGTKRTEQTETER